MFLINLLETIDNDHNIDFSKFIVISVSQCENILVFSSILSFSTP